MAVADAAPGIVLDARDTSVPAFAALASMDGHSLRDEADQLGPFGFPDPLEPVNRAIFAFNLKLDRFVYSPITRVYRFIVPTPARRAVRRVLLNVDTPVTFVNDVLQLEPRDAGVSLLRFIINSTIGIGGLFDVAGAVVGLPGPESDFGQTMALAGMPSGPYLIVPLLGPSNTRDAAGYVIDFLFRPTTYLATPLFTLIFEGGTEFAHGMTTRELQATELQALQAWSIDYYAALRNAYYQSRTAFVWRRGPALGPLARDKQV